MKGLTKTIVAIALVTTLIATMGMSAMAAATYTTKTTYQANGKISVEANATGLEEGDIVTYVATTDATDVNENTIVYINQAEADSEGKASFTYTTSVTNIDADMFFGGSKENTRVAAKHADDYVITVTVNGTEAGSVYAAQQAEGAGVVIRKFDLSGIANFSAVEITSVAFGKKAIADFCVAADTLIVSTDAINESGTLAITTTAAPKFTAPKISGTTKVTDAGNLIAVAKAPAGKQFGIVVYTTEQKPTITAHTYTQDKGLLVLPALGKNVEGIYAVEVEAIKEFIGDKFNVAAYAFNGTEAELSDLVKSITIAE